MGVEEKQKLSGEQILNRLAELFNDNISAFAYGDYLEADSIGYNSDLDWKENEQKAIETIGLGPIEIVEQYGGEEQGSTWYSVKYFPDHDVYIRTDGYYTSYHGTDFEYGIGKVVTPKEKKITVYE